MSSHVSSPGEHRSFAIDDMGRVYAWGANSYGQLGVGDQKHRKFPTLINALEGKIITSVVFNEYESYALDNDGYIYLWGAIPVYRGFIAKCPQQCVPSQIQALQGKTIKKIVIGAYEKFALDENNDIFGWSSTAYSMYSLESKVYSYFVIDDSFNPSLVKPPLGWMSSGIFLGYKSIFFINKIGQVFAQGSFDENKLGLGKTKSQEELQSFYLIYVTNRLQNELSDLKLSFDEKVKEDVKKKLFEMLDDGSFEKIYIEELLKKFQGKNKKKDEKDEL